MDLDFVRIECDIAVKNPDQVLAPLHDAVRSFEAEFRAVCCSSRQEPCSSCALSGTCPYRTVFGQQLSSDPETVRLHQKPSLPFSLYIEVLDTVSSTCTLGMVIIGSAVNHIDIFHTALLRTATACISCLLPRPTILQTFSLDYQGLRHPIGSPAYIHENVILLSGRHIMENTLHSDSVLITLKSPLRLMSNGTIAHRFDFAAFFRSQLRRCSSLCAYYGSGAPELDYASLSDASHNVAVLEDGIRYTLPSWSLRLNRAGLLGVAECCGLTEPMLPLLILGSYVNAGKGASYGSGYHTIGAV